MPAGKTVDIDCRRERGQSVQQGNGKRSFADVVSQGKARKARIFMGDYIIRKVGKVVKQRRGHHGMPTRDNNRGCSMSGRTGHGWWHRWCCSFVGMNNAEEEGTSAIVGKHRRLVKTRKEARFGQIVLSGILPII